MYQVELAFGLVALAMRSMLMPSALTKFAASAAKARLSKRRARVRACVCV